MHEELDFLKTFEPLTVGEGKENRKLSKLRKDISSGLNSPNKVRQSSKDKAIQEMFENVFGHDKSYQKVAMSRSTLLAAIKQMDINNYQNKTKRRAADTPGAYLPNISSFAVKFKEITVKGETTRLDPIFQSKGINKKLAVDLVTEVYDNKPMNRYMEHQLLRMKKLMDQPNKFGILAFSIMKQSNVFRVAAFNHVMKNGHRTYPLTYVTWINRKVSKIFNRMDSKLIYRRVYIPKGDTFRPLGVPNPEWRIVTHMINNFLVMFLDRHCLDSQHGFRPGRGTLTAGKEFFLSEIGKKKYIYEFDLKQCFPSLSVGYVTQNLKRYGVPNGVVEYLENINLCNPILPKEQKLEEETYKLSPKAKSALETKQFDPTAKIFETLRDMLGMFDEDIMTMVKEDGHENVVTGFEAQGGMFDQYAGRRTMPNAGGLAQGVPTSPFLTMLSLKDFFAQQSGISYADDGIFYGDTAFNIKDDPENGINLSEAKSGGIKYNGIGKKPLKFLGLEFDGKHFKAKTRNKATLELGSEVKELVRAIDNYQHNNGHGVLEASYPSRETLLTSGEEVFKSQIIGFIQNRMYNDKGSLDHLEQDFRLKFVDKSGLSLNKRHITDPQISVFTSSSYASRSLAAIFRMNSRLRKTNLNSKITLKFSGSF